MRSPEFEVFYDGECPLCLREINFLKRRDRDRSCIVFTDIASPDFDASHLGIDHAQLMARIHGKLPDGTLVQGVEVFRRLYAAVGFSWLVALSRLPGIAQLLGIAYTVFARNRLRLTGRCDTEACSVRQ
ncbi:MAG: DUF393 domain-containing protein [Proteobacteria bacterium]|nr:DUF393 domain-containing protein [Pseudomonadota bacterium]